MRALEFIKDHLIFKLHYDQIYQMKTAKMSFKKNVLSNFRTGYVPGEMIGFNAEMDNQSDRQMNGSTLK